MTVNQKKPLVIVTRRLPHEIETRLMELFEVRLNIKDNRMSREELTKAIEQADILVPTVTDQITKDMLAHANVKLIANFGVGVDNIDIKAANDKGILVSNTPRVLTEDTADMVMALLLSVSRRLAEGDRLVRSGAWDGWGPTAMLGHRIGGKRLGIIGMGRIGREVAKRAKSFGIAIHYHNRNRVSEEVEESLEATYWPDLDEMMAHMDYVSVNCPKTAETEGMLNRERLSYMRKNSFLINTARGGIIDEDALAELLSKGLIGGAALDVYQNAPHVCKALLGLDNVILLPHIASATVEGRQAMGERVIINIKSFVDGHRPPDRIFPNFIK